MRVCSMANSETRSCLRILSYMFCTRSCVLFRVLVAPTASSICLRVAVAVDVAGMTACTVVCVWRETWCRTWFPTGLIANTSSCGAATHGHRVARFIVGGAALEHVVDGLV